VWDLIKELGIAWPAVLDVTYGVGGFWVAGKPELLIGSDVKVWQWKVVPDVFILSPSWAVHKVIKKLGLESRIDLVVIDPPWSSYTHRGRSYYTYAYGSDRDILMGGLRTARSIGAKYVLIHYREVLIPEGWELIKKVKFIYVSRYLKNNNINTSPNTTWFYTLTPKRP